MVLHKLADEALGHIPHQRGEEPQAVHPLPGLMLLRHHRCNAFQASLYEPVVCLIVQGQKETTLGSHRVVANVGDVLLISHDLPVVSRVTQAPYLALLFSVEVATLRGLYDEVAEAGLSPTPARAMEGHQADPALIEALRRYLALGAGPQADARVLGPLLVKEIHYRLLAAPFGGMLRSLLRYDSPASAVGRAIAHIRRDFRSTIAVPDLAQRVGMSTSAFHKHFKAITYSTPLQYQKDLRLMEARRLLAMGGASVTVAAYEVGYESASQFSREYARKFGVPPSHDMAEQHAVQMA